MTQNRQGALYLWRLLLFAMVLSFRRSVVIGPDRNYGFPLFLDFQGVAHETQSPEENRELHTAAGNGTVQRVLENSQPAGQGGF